MTAHYSAQNGIPAHRENISRWTLWKYQRDNGRYHEKKQWWKYKRHPRCQLWIPNEEAIANWEWMISRFRLRTTICSCGLGLSLPFHLLTNPLHCRGKRRCVCVCVCAGGRVFACMSVYVRMLAGTYLWPRAFLSVIAERQTDVFAEFQTGIHWSHESHRGWFFPTGYTSKL